MVPLYEVNCIINTVCCLLYKPVMPNHTILGSVINDFSSSNDKITVVSSVCINFDHLVTRNLKLSGFFLMQVNALRWSNRDCFNLPSAT